MHFKAKEINIYIASAIKAVKINKIDIELDSHERALNASLGKNYQRFKVKLYLSH